MRQHFSVRAEDKKGLALQKTLKNVVDFFVKGFTRSIVWDVCC